MQQPISLGFLFIQYPANMITSSLTVSVSGRPYTLPPFLDAFYAEVHLVACMNLDQPQDIVIVVSWRKQ